MIGYVTIGYNDADATLKFYDGVLGALGLQRTYWEGGFGSYGRTPDDSMILLCRPFDGKDARGGNGIMIAFKGETADQVKAAHAAGLEAGGADEGTPGPRPADSTSFYGAYLRDPTGNKIAVFCKP